MRSEEGIGAPGVGVTGGCELSNVGARNLTQVLLKGNLCLQPLSNLSRPPLKKSYFHPIIPVNYLLTYS